MIHIPKTMLQRKHNQPHGSQDVGFNEMPVKIIVKTVREAMKESIATSSRKRQQRVGDGHWMQYTVLSQWSGACCPTSSPSTTSVPARQTASSPLHAGTRLRRAAP